MDVDEAPPEELSRVQRTRATIAAWTERAQKEATAARGRYGAVDAAFAAYERDRRTVGSVLAGAVAFRVFVFLLPLFLAMIVVLGVLQRVDDEAPEDAADSLGFSAYVVDSVATAAEESNDSMLLLAPLAAWALYLSSRATAKVIWAIHALAWDQPISRPPSTSKAAGWTILFAVGGFAVIAFGQAARAQSSGLGIGAAVVSIIPFIGLWYAITWVLPRNPLAPWTALLPGAVLVGTGVWLANLVSSLYLAHTIDHASELYGGMGASAAMLAWLYLLGRLVVGSAMVNATLWQRSRETPE